MRQQAIAPVILLWMGASLVGCTASKTVVLSTNDNRAVFVEGKIEVAKDPQPDTISILDFSRFPPKITEIAGVSNSVIGPPTNVKLLPGENLALVASSMRIDPNDRTRQVPDDVVHVIDLASSPPKVIYDVKTGLQPSGIGLSPDRRMAIVADKADGTVTVLSIEDRQLRNVGIIKVGQKDAGVSDVVIAPNGKLALVSKSLKKGLVAILKIDGLKVTYTGIDLAVGKDPYAMCIAPDGKFAFVAATTEKCKDIKGTKLYYDAAYVIDLRADPPCVINTCELGICCEQITISSDGRLVAASLMMGSNLAKHDPGYSSHGMVRLFTHDAGNLILVDEKPVGAIPEGVAFTPDGRYLIVQNYIDKNLSVFRVKGRKLEDTGLKIVVSGQPAGISAAVFTK